MDQYSELVRRNAGYIDKELQEKIASTRLLVAGCGVGSSIAESAVRLGFRHLTLIDADVVEHHNLNRQQFVAGDVATKKVHAMKKRLLAINSEAEINAYDCWLEKKQCCGSCFLARYRVRYNRHLGFIRHHRIER